VQFDTALGMGHEEAALASCGGDRLPGCHLAGAPDFTRWLERRTGSGSAAVAGVGTEAVPERVAL
jgi:hypothetical protein